MTGFSRRRVLQGAGAVTGALLLTGITACGNDDDSNGSEPTSSPGSDPTTGSGSGNGAPSGTLRVAHANLGEELLDGHLPNTGANTPVFFPMYESLTQYDPETGNLAPRLATKWENGPDELDWVFTLRSDVQDHDGNPVDAETIVWNLDRQAELGGSGSFGQYYDSSEAIDATTVRVRSNEPLAIAPDIFGAVYIFSRTAYEEAGEDAFFQRPVATGPFAFVSRTVGQGISYRANENHWNAPPGVENLEFSIVPELTTRVAQLRTGEVDLITGVTGPAVDEIESIDGLKLKEIQDASFLMLEAFDMLKADSPLHDPRVMQAANHAIDKDALINGLFQGRAKDAPYGFMGPSTLGHVSDLEPYAYDPERARELLAEAGYPDGIDLPEMYSLQLGQYPNSVAMIEALNNFLAEVGIRAPLASLDYGTYIANQREQGIFGLNVISSQNVPEIQQRLGTWVKSTGLHSAYDFPELDALIEAAEHEFDPDAREGILQDITRFIHDWPMFVFTVNASAYFAQNEKVSDWPQSIASTYIDNLHQVTIQA